MSILVNTGFKVGSAEPLNEYSIRETIDDRDALVTDRYVYEGMEVYCKDTKVKYRWNGAAWEEVGTGGSGGGSDVYALLPTTQIDDQIGRIWLENL